MRLRHVLKKDNRILQINDISDIQQLKETKQDRLVEVKGRIFRSPLSEALEAVSRIMGMLGIELSHDAAPQSHAAGGGKRKRGKGQQPPSEHNQFTPDASARLGPQLTQRIGEDLAKSKVVDVVMYPSTIEGLKTIVALALEFFPEGAFENLLSGDFSVLGKVTRIAEGNDEISLYQRTAFSYLNSSDLDSMFAKLQQESSLKLSKNPSSVQAPALQLMPLAIYI